MNIILATDGTPSGDAAAEAVKNYDLKQGDRVQVVSVIDMALPMSMDAFGGNIPDTGGFEKAAREHAEKIVADAAARLNAHFDKIGVEIASKVLFGSPDSRIVETAEESDADLIVIGSHGYNSWERLLLGSVSTSVVHHAPCSVLVVRQTA